MYVKVREEVPKTTKSTKKFKNVWESTKLYQEVPKKCQKVPKGNKSAERYQKLPLSTKKNQGEPKVR